MRFKKIASVLAGAALLGMTVAAPTALAATYPQPFVSQNGAADVAIVYGSHAAAQNDLAAAVNVQNSLSQHVRPGSSTGTTPTGGDFVKLERSSEKFNLGENAKDVFITSLTKEHLPQLLADGEYRDENNGEFRYTQKIVLNESLQLNHFRDTDFSDSPVIGINLDSSAEVLTYLLEFTKHPDFTESAMKNTDLPLFGRNYFVLEVDGDTDSITLLDSSGTTSLDLGEIQTVSVGGRSYQVSIRALSTSGVILQVNGEQTRTLNIGDTYRLTDGAYIGVKSLVAGQFQGATNFVEFTIGSGKLVLTDGLDVEMNDDGINGLQAIVTNQSGKLTNIGLTWKTDDREFITPTSEIVMPGFETIKFSMAGFYTPLQERTVVERDGADSIRIRAPIRDGQADINLLYKESGADEFSGFGRNAQNKLATSNVTTLTVNRTDNERDAVVSWSSNSNREGESHYVTFVVSPNKNGANRTTIRSKIAGGPEYCTDVAPTGTCTIGNSVLTIDSIAATDSSTWVIELTGSSGTEFNTLYTREGLKFYLPYLDDSTDPGAMNFTGEDLGNNATEWFLYGFEEDRNENLEGGPGIRMALAANSDDRLHVRQVRVVNNGDLAVNTSLGQEQRMGDSSDSYETYVISELATRIVHNRAGSEYSAELTYHGAESYAEVFLSDTSARLGSGGSGNLVPVTDTEVNSYSGKNLVVIGGSCVNSVAAQLLGSSTPLCGESWTQRTGVGMNQYLIETFSRSGGKVATLVAGYGMGDTANAAQALTTRDVTTDVNTKYTGSTVDDLTSSLS